MKRLVKEMKFGVTEEYACSYLAGKMARNLFLDPSSAPDQETAVALTKAGFRRTGNHLFKPYCPNCRACIPVRLRVREFRARRRHRRIWQKNADLCLKIEQPAFREDWYQLYARYIRTRHAQGEMYPPSRSQFREFLLSRWSHSLFLCSYLDDRVMSIAVTDVIGDAGSAVYTFYDPDEGHRSLGVFSILLQTSLSKICGKNYLYLGYWINGHEKMHYKLEFSPSEALLGDGRWVLCPSLNPRLEESQLHCAETRQSV